MSEPSIGDNSQPKFAREHLKTIIGRVERLNDEIKELGNDRTDIFKEAAGQGYDVKALRRVIAIRKMDAGEHDEFEDVVNTYMAALEPKA